MDRYSFDVELSHLLLHAGLSRRTPLRSARITRPHRYYETVRPCAPHRYSAPRRFRCSGCSLSPTAGQHPAGPYRGDRFPRSVPEPEPSSRHLYAGHHLASQQAPARLVPGQQRDPGFDDIDTLSTLHQWFTHARLLDPHLTPSRAPFPQRSPPRLLTAAARGGLRPPPAGRSRRAYLHHQHNTASEVPASTPEPPQRSWHTIVGVAFERATRELPIHPFVERVVHEEVGQQLARSENPVGSPSPERRGSRPASASGR